MFDNIKKSIDIIQNIPQWIEGLKKDIQTLTDIKKEIQSQNQKIKICEKRLDELECLISQSFIASNSNFDNFRKKSIEQYTCIDNTFKNLESKISTSSSIQEETISLLKNNNKEIDSRLNEISQMQLKISEISGEFINQQQLLADKIDENNSQITFNLKTSHDIDKLLREVMCEEFRTKIQNIHSNLIHVIKKLDCQNDGMSEIDTRLSSINYDIKNMDNAARLILLASVISELDKSIEHNS